MVLDPVDQLELVNHAQGLVPLLVLNQRILRVQIVMDNGPI